MTTWERGRRREWEDDVDDVGMRVRTVPYRAIPTQSRTRSEIQQTNLPVSVFFAGKGSIRRISVSMAPV